MNKLRESLLLIDNNLLLLLSLFLIAFIPLFPKIPLFDILPGYIVRVRIEDFLVFFTGLVWIREVRRGRAPWNTSYFWLVATYALAGLFSIFLGVVLLQTIPAQLLHIGKSGLHYVRYLEYFALFFFLFAAVKTKKQVLAVMFMTSITLIGVVGYGLGQQYFHFPVYSTMNREYSKGERLYLQAGARPQSTFAGHYDLAAYLVIILPLLCSLSLGYVSAPQTRRKLFIIIGLQIVHLAGLAMLILSASKVSLLGYGVGLLLILLWHWWRLPTRTLRVISASVILGGGVIVLLFAWFLNPLGVRTRIQSRLASLQRSTTALPVDLVGDGYYEKVIATSQPDGSVVYTKIREKSTWSENALKYGLSMGIRLDTLWPQALLGLARSPLTGAGYGTLAMLNTQAFIEADSTDNNFLRTLGETGVIGALTFYGFILVLLRQLVRAQAQSRDPVTRALFTGFVGSTIGLLIAATYIDVFAASKVAFTYWALAGVLMRLASLQPQSSDALRVVSALWAHLRRHVGLYLSIGVLFFFLHQNPFLPHSLTKDIETATTSLKELTSARCLLRHGTLSLCRNDGLELTSHPSPYAALLAVLLRLTSVYGVFSYLNFALILILFLCCYPWMRRRLSQFQIFSLYLLLILIATKAQLTQAPLSLPYFWLVLLGFPLSIWVGAQLWQRQQTHKRILSPLIGMSLGVASLWLASTTGTARFHTTREIPAYTAIELMNNWANPTASQSAAVISAANPYYVDLYSTNQYTLLPLSLQQTYGDQADRVWGTSAVQATREGYQSLFANQTNLFVSDYHVADDPIAREAFLALKRDTTLRYQELGCQEQCNLYRVTPRHEPVSPLLRSAINTRTLDPRTLTPPYTFSILSNRFDPRLSDPAIPHRTRSLGERLQPRQRDPLQFLLITGDVMERPEYPRLVEFGSAFAERALYPVLYSPGNEDLAPQKYLQDGFSTYFTDHVYFIFLDVQANSHWSSGKQLQFYNALLELEQLPPGKRLVIVSHNLNWQDDHDPDNAIHAIRRKLQEYPKLETTIITRNHQPEAAEWYVSRRDTTLPIQYAASLVAGDPRDVMLDVSVTPDQLQLTPQPLPLLK